MMQGCLPVSEFTNQPCLPASAMSFFKVEGLMEEGCSWYDIQSTGIKFYVLE